MVDGVDGIAELVRYGIVCASRQVLFVLLVEEGGATQVGGIGIEFIDCGTIKTIVGLREVSFEFGVIDGPSGVGGGDIVFVVDSLPRLLS